MDLLEIGLALKAARKKRGVTQEKLASRLKIGRSTLSGIENGIRTEASIRLIVSLCDHLGLKLDIKEKGPRPTYEDLLREG
jgi:transcriptional regulator with XRE-family HTH domain